MNLKRGDKVICMSDNVECGYEKGKVYTVNQIFYKGEECKHISTEESPWVTLSKYFVLETPRKKGYPYIISI